MYFYCCYQVLTHFIQSFTKLSFRRLMVSCGFIQTIMSVVLCFLFKEFPRRREEGRVKIRQWLRWEQNRDFPTTPSFTPVALSLSHNFILVILIFFHIYHYPTTKSFSSIYFPHNSLTPEALSLSHIFIIIIPILFFYNTTSTPMFHFIWMLMTFMIYNDGPH